MPRVELPWGAWFGDIVRGFDLPDGYEASLCTPRPLEPLTEARVDAALERPVAASSLGDLARGRRDAVIVVEDITRPARTAEILPRMLRILRGSGILERENPDPDWNRGTRASGSLQLAQEARR